VHIICRRIIIFSDLVIVLVSRKRRIGDKLTTNSYANEYLIFRKTTKFEPPENQLFHSRSYYHLVLMNSINIIKQWESYATTIFNSGGVTIKIIYGWLNNFFFYISTL